MTVSRGALHRFVDGALTVRLATISKKGTPLVTPLWFARAGDAIYVGSRRGSPHVRNMTDNPRVVMLFGDRRGARTDDVLRVTGTARVRDYSTTGLKLKLRFAWRYYFGASAIGHWMRNWRKIAVRNRYYAERTDGAMVEISLEDAEFVRQP